MAIYLYYIGVGTFSLLIISLVIIRIKEDRDSGFTKISRVSEITNVV